MKILWFVSTIEDTNFLRSFAKYFDGEIDVFHLNFITYFDLRSFKATHILPKWGKEYASIVTESPAKCFNVLSGRLLETDAHKAYQATSGQLQKYLQKQNDSVFFMIPSGRHIHHMAATHLAKQEGIKRLYINYSNFPGYTFFDPEGTDCNASIYRDTTLLNRFENENINVEDIFEKFAKLKAQQKAIPQKASSGFNKYIKNMAFYGDTLLQKAAGVISDRKMKFGFQSANKSPLLLETSSILPDEAFLFFPLQVSTDQQVLINYGKGNIIEAINEAFELAQQTNKPLIVREHPAEGRPDLIRRHLSEMVGKYQGMFYVSSLPVTELIEKCDKVVTINSTVGLESRINKKQVEFLGRSFYQKATDFELASYLSHFLVEVDYHESHLSKELVNEIIHRF